MTDKELNSIGQWLNTKGYDLDLTDCFWMEDCIENETKFRDIAELLQEYHKEQLLIQRVSDSSNYEYGVKEFGLKITYSKSDDGRQFLEVFADNGGLKFQEWCKYKDGSFNYR